MKIGQRITTTPTPSIEQSIPIPENKSNEMIPTPSDGYTLMISRMDGTIKVVGQPSHTEYIFTNEKRIIPIKNEDVPDLEKKKRKFRPCCNANTDNLQLFEIYKS